MSRYQPTPTDIKFLNKQSALQDACEQEASKNVPQEADFDKYAERASEYRFLFDQRKNLTKQLNALKNDYSTTAPTIYWKTVVHETAPANISKELAISMLQFAIEEIEQKLSKLLTAYFK